MPEDTDWKHDRKDGGAARCKRCGERGLIWENQDGRWVLVTLGGRRHDCPTKPRLTARPDARDEFKEYME